MANSQRHTWTFARRSQTHDTATTLRLPFSPEKEDEWKAASYFWYELVEKYNPIYRLAGFHRYLICIPEDESLPTDVTCLPYSVLKAHILRPTNPAATQLATANLPGYSNFEGDVFPRFSSLLGEQHVVEVKGNILHSTQVDVLGNRSDWTATVSQREAMVNADGQIFWVFFINQPLVGLYTEKESRRASLRVEQRHQTVDDFRSFLHGFRSAHEAAANLDMEVEIFCVSYLCMPNYEELLVAKVNQMFETAVEEFAVAIPMDTESPKYYTLQLAVHCYLLSGIHQKVWGHWISMFVEEDAQFVQYCVVLSTTITMKELGIEEELQQDQTSSIHCLQKIDTLLNPYEKLYCIKETMEFIANNVPEHLRDGLSADMMLPLLIYVIMQARPPHIDTTVNYLSVFQFPELAAGPLGYAFASFEAAVFFIRQEAITREEAAAKRNAHVIGEPHDVQLETHFSDVTPPDEIRSYLEGLTKTSE
eukprot:TRINITY_DN11296_c0_g1_i1.p1 TRINITY_DN11296_c0_g1~~TRINITY_DN11296_c0_g1_i1.p1  ORF type:complete len:478 (-),score=59.31 TRINITY_DN11296_c0_g1_i1:36-1469(-)